MTIPKLTPYTGQVANPDGSQTQTEFTQNMFGQLSYEAQLATELDATIDGMNNAVDEVEANATSAENSANAAEAAASTAGYQGLWPDTGGSANKGETWQTQVGGTPTGEYYTALQNTSVDPVGDNVNWREVISVESLGGLTNYQAESVDQMIAGVTITGQTVQHVIGQVWTINGRWRYNGGTSGTIADFEAVGGVVMFKDFNPPVTDSIDLMLTHVVPLVNAGGVRKLIINEQVKLSGTLLFTADDFEISGEGALIADESVSESGVHLVSMSGDRNTIKIFVDGNRDNTSRPYETPNGSMVTMSGLNPTYGCNTQNAQGYMATITGKNPTILDIEDYNSAYAGLRLFPNEPWDYVKGGKITFKKVSTLGKDPSGISTRGLMINGQHTIDLIDIDGYHGIGTGSLIDSASGTNLELEYTPFFKKVKFGYLVIDNPIPSYNTSTGLIKWENCGEIEIGYCHGVHDDENEQRGFWFGDTGGVTGDFQGTLGTILTIGTFSCNQQTILPRRVRISRCDLSGSMRTSNYFQPARSPSISQWWFGIISYDTTEYTSGQVSTQAVLNGSGSNFQDGTNIIVGQYIDTPNPANLFKADGITSDIFTCYTPGFTSQIGSAAGNSVKQRVPKQNVLYNLSNLQGSIVKGDIIWTANTAAGGTMGWVCTTSGEHGSTAVMKTFGTIEG